ncbi:MULTISPECIES: helix-turn-helix transcriptional regulator [Rhodococcus]|jgi:DNA-binding CsgD family transcriptional regulator|uniref:helix-turn-helix transcriptional regulator n=1 Tax=Rhodococcus TaxID=1827 RepID=UPI0015CE663D|nr:MULTISPECIES: helix-turn-helix transcriptional regulator [Rhodococcus]MBP1160911.1 DNA-binding CsgD family transcriptional regulator [Rhodococcus sp. PvR099]MCZ4557377.1 helix-turn-helix transcriptional regulator [Rhodococcus maanshanensis]
MSASSARERLGAAVRLRAEVGAGARAPEAGRLLFALRAAVPHDHAALSRWDPMRRQHLTSASFGYSPEAARTLNQRMQDLPLFADLQQHRIPLRLHDIEPGRRHGAIFDDVIGVHGYRDGLSHCLFSPDGRYVGMLNLSTYAEDGVDDQSLALVSLLAETLAESIDPLASAEGGRVRVEPGEEAFVVDAAGRPWPVTAGASPRLLGAGEPWRDQCAAGAEFRILIVDGEVFRVRLESVRAGTLVRYRGVEAPAELTLRELEVLVLVSGGRSNAQIAAALGVGAATVATHVENILRKTGSPNRTAAAVFATRVGLSAVPARQ